ncbi:MAG TPA: cytochrome c biogenesis protein CcsA [Bacteroidales bacterium]|nr:cytochrome c biogenesis protein CcsA [Bacteroidales bacterium]
MLKRISFLFGMPLTGILLMVLIVAMALATFIESGMGTSTAWAVIYDAWWFEAIFFLVLVNLVGNIFVMKLYRRSKLAVFIFHVAFILIIVGGGITRYFSLQGMMHIREGQVTGSIISNNTYMDVIVSVGENEITDSKKVLLSSLTPRKFSWRGELNGMKVKIRSVDYIQNAAMQYVATPGGDPYLQMILLAGGRYTVGLKKGEVADYSSISVSFDNPAAGADLDIQQSGDSLVAFSNHPVAITTMGEGVSQQFEPGTPIPFSQEKLYSMRDARFALQRFLPSARIRYVHATDSQQGSGMDVARLEVSLNGMKSDLFVSGRNNMVGEPATIQMGDLQITCTYGSHRINLPFALRLEDFRIDRYPGSNSPSSFESDVRLLDPQHNIDELHNIYMNNVLKHRGYRFYQSSYDQDEKGSILSVNRDRLGTGVTYAGYFFMTLGMILALFVKGTRFSALSRSTARRKAAAGIILLLLTSGSVLSAQNYPAPPKVQAESFGELWVQGKEGRFKPVNTLSNEVMRKVIKKSKFDGKSADQVLLGMIAYPDAWKNAPIFEVENAQLHQMIGFKGQYVSFNDFISEQGYILSGLVNEAYKKRVQERTDLDKEVMKLDEKINVFYMVQTGAFLKIFPDPEAEDHAWTAVSDLIERSHQDHAHGTPGSVSVQQHAESDTLAKVFLLYTGALRDGDYALADDIVSFIGRYQRENTTYELDEGKRKAEILYNKLNLFQRLIKFYGLFGAILLIMQFLRIFRPARWVEYMFKVGVVHLIVAFALHTVFFGLRWYVSGHAPLSNGYESMIFVSWISLLAGLIFVRRTGFAMALTAILSTLALLVAHMSWMNPDITNLVPVLKSPWLTIHVTVIMAGYGFLGLSMLMGLTNLAFYAVANKKNRTSISNVVTQLTKVNHLSVIIGLYFLTVGTFLGGVWANESWGRYWGWDPKETWALISVLVYTFVTHMHRFPGMKGGYAFNLATLLGFFSILMTYFGVNYFLGGIHSYAGGAAFSIPFWVYLAVMMLFALSLLAYYRQKVLADEYLEEEV